MANKKGFIMYADLLDNIESLTMEQRGILLTAILCDQAEKNLPQMDGAVTIAFSFIKKGIDINTTKYNEICEKRKESGKKGGRPPKTENQIKAKETKINQINPNETKAKAKKPDNREQISDISNQISDNGDEQKDIIRYKYGEYQNVFLSNFELMKLRKDFPENIVQDKIDALSSYMVSTGKVYKSHYATIRNWINKDHKEGGGDNVSEDRGKVFDVEDFL